MPPRDVAERSGSSQEHGGADRRRQCRWQGRARAGWVIGARFTVVLSLLCCRCGAGGPAVSRCCAAVQPLGAPHRGLIHPGSLVAVVPTVRPISADEHRAFIREQPWASFLQTPAWATVKSEWRARVARLVRRRPAGRRRAGALPPAAQADAATSPTCPRVRCSTGPTDDLGAWLAPMADAPARARAPSGSGWARRSSPAAGAPTRSRPASPTTAVRRLGRRSPRRSARPTGARVVQQLEALGWRPQVAEGGVRRRAAAVHLRRSRWSTTTARGVPRTTCSPA